MAHPPSRVCVWLSLCGVFSHYIVEGADLVLQPDVGGVMLATITPPQNGTFRFKSVGGGPEDKGLEFRKL